LVSYDEQYAEYLKAVGIPGFVVNMFILGSKEVVKVVKTGNHIKFTTETEDIVGRVAEFTLGELTELPYGRNMEGIMHTMCNLEEPNRLFCTSEERTKGWTLTSEHIFSKGGVMNTRHHVNKGIKTKKFYQRQGIELDEESMVTVEGMVTVPPKNEIEDPFSSSSSEDEDFFSDNDFFND